MLNTEYILFNCNLSEIVKMSPLFYRFIKYKAELFFPFIFHHPGDFKLVIKSSIDTVYNKYNRS